MLFKALIISILLHVLVLCWAGANLPFSPARQKRSIPAPPTHQIISLVEPSVLTVAQPVVGEAPPIVETAPAEVNGPRPLQKQAPTVEARPSPVVPFIEKTGTEQLPHDMEPEPSLPQERERAVSSLTSTSMKQKEASTTEEETGVSSSTEKLTVNTGQVISENKPVAPLSHEPASNDTLYEYETKSVVPTWPEVQNDPVKSYHLNPVYPRQARRRGWEGTVCLQAHINKEGKVAEASVSTSSGFELLDQAALEAVKQWQYQWPPQQPEALNEKLIVIKVIFELEE